MPWRALGVYSIKIIVLSTPEAKAHQGTCALGVYSIKIIILSTPEAEGTSGHVEIHVPWRVVGVYSMNDRFMDSRR